jgi:hypothetical protein
VHQKVSNCDKTIGKSRLVAKFWIPLLNASKVTAQEVLVVSIDKRDIGYCLRSLQKCLQTRSNLIYSMGCSGGLNDNMIEDRDDRHMLQEKCGALPNCPPPCEYGAGIQWAENASVVKSKPRFAAAVLHSFGHSVLLWYFVSCEVCAVLASHLFYTSYLHPALLLPTLDVSDFAESIECNAGCRMTSSSFRRRSIVPTL